MSAPASSSSNRSRPGIFEWTGLQFLRPTPRRAPAELAMAELAPLDAPCPLTLPDVEDVPGGTASLDEIGAFIARFDPTRHFREQWGERYRVAIEALWDECVSAYRGSRSPAASGGELLLCLAYDWRLGTYLGVASTRSSSSCDLCSRTCACARELRRLPRCSTSVRLDASARQRVG